MAVGGEDERKIYFRDRKMNLREVTIKFGRLLGFMRHDSAEIWGLGMDSHLDWYSKNYSQHRFFRACNL
jgi:hypothetical protein